MTFRDKLTRILYENNLPHSTLKEIEGCVSDKVAMRDFSRVETYLSIAIEKNLLDQINTLIEESRKDYNDDPQYGDDISTGQTS